MDQPWGGGAGRPPAGERDDHLPCAVGARGARRAWVGDLEVSLDFFVVTLGFDLRAGSTVVPGACVAQVAPPGGGLCLVLAEAAGPAPDSLGGRTGVVFETPNLERATGYLEFRGVHFEPAGAGMLDAVRFFDPDSSHYLLVEVAPEVTGQI